MNDKNWWQSGVIYQIYPRSFQDSNNDGVGDLPGITSRLDYLSQTLGVDVVWLSPIYPSPMHDFGYDVADYCGIHPLFGSMADFDRLLAEIHQRGMKLILDLVPNHTSDEHPWFIESRSSRDNPKRDWYIWRDPSPGGAVPNNWLSYFGGPAWTFEEKNGQYYLHQFLTQQPELNYRNPAVVAALHDTMRFWLEKGVDGFRVDVIWLMMKDPLFRDEPPNPHWDGINRFDSLLHIYTANLTEVHDLVRGMRKVLDEYDDRMMVGEIYLPNAELVKYYGAPEQRECHLPFNFQLISTKWNAASICTTVNEYEAALPPDAWPNWVLGNHDQHRLATRVGAEQARCAAMLLLTLRGTPTCYYGDEIGMKNVPIPPQLVQDPPAVNQPEIAHIYGRDPERTPMQWDDSPHSGFSSPDAKSPWLPLAADYPVENVACQLENPHSILNLYRELLSLRRASPALQNGAYHSLDNKLPDVFVYERISANQHLVICLNFSGMGQSISFPGVGRGNVILSTSLVRRGDIDLDDLHIAPNEGIIFDVKKANDDANPLHPMAASQPMGRSCHSTAHD